MPRAENLQKARGAHTTQVVTAPRPTAGLCGQAYAEKSATLEPAMFTRAKRQADHQGDL